MQDGFDSLRKRGVAFRHPHRSSTVRWPKLDSCLLLASPCRSPGRCFRATDSRFSKHQFTQPQLLAILCLMRYEDWAFREAEVRLGEHRELRSWSEEIQV